MTTETKCLRGECNTPSSCKAHNECLALDQPEDSRELGSLYAGTPSIEPETETVAGVLADLDAMASECGGLQSETIHAMTQRIAAAHAREVGALVHDVSAYERAATAESERADRFEDGLRVAVVSLAHAASQNRLYECTYIHIDKVLRGEIDDATPTREVLR